MAARDGMAGGGLAGRARPRKGGGKLTAAAKGVLAHYFACVKWPIIQD